MNLSNFTRGYSQGGKGHCEKPWLVSKRGVVVATDGIILLIRNVRKTDKYQEIPKDICKSFKKYLNHRPSRKAKKINVAQLRRFAGKGETINHLDNYVPMRPGMILGKRFNRNPLALALKLVDESEMTAELVECSTGIYLVLTGKDWRITLMEVRVNDLELEAKTPPLPVFIID